MYLVKVDDICDTYEGEPCALWVDLDDEHFEVEGNDIYILGDRVAQLKSAFSRCLTVEEIKVAIDLLGIKSVSG